MSSSFQDQKLAFIGGGNMGAAIINGLLSGGFQKSNITVSEPWDVNRAKLAATGVKTTTSNPEAAKDADLVILAVKPQVCKTVCVELAGAWATAGRNTLPTVVSIAAGIGLASMQEWLRLEDGRVPHVVRAMPNTPALVGEGAVGLYAAVEVTKHEKELIAALLGSVSKVTEWVAEEQLLDVVTGVSGSGPAYFFLLVENMIASAVSLGMPEEQATRLAAQTCLGAGKMLRESPETPAKLRQNVTSPNGTTQAAIETFQSLKFPEIVGQAVKAAVDRSVELGKPQ